MQNQQLNLARKWRSKTFDQVVGQELCVKMLKNSLYLNKFFPVYLFSGQRGCGKTTTARIFAAALNCGQLESFQKQPKNTVIPCLKCPSCLAMASNNHPDFIEMDAASHTGVDNVRSLIEAACLLPVMGTKKIYLIDEAHMLSKAAFNAFLKLLEEPPDSVIFILATTDPEKIIDTVKSRCFQLFFTAIEQQKLVSHLEVVCKKESIVFEKTALNLIVKETEGSARDALNLLEQVRFSSGSVTHETVLKSLGHLSENELAKLIGFIINQDKKGIIDLCQKSQFQQYNAVVIWQKCVEYIKALLYYKIAGLESDSVYDLKIFEKLASLAHQDFLGFCLEQFYQQELILTKTTVQHGLLEMLFLRLSEAHKKKIELVSPVVAQAAVSGAEKKNKILVAAQQTPAKQIQKDNKNQQWQKFLDEIQALNDPLLFSLFQQSMYKNFDDTLQKVTIEFSQDSLFFNDWLQETEKLWSDLLKKIFGKNAQAEILFTGKKSEKKVPTSTPLNVQAKKTEQIIQQNRPKSPIKDENKKNFRSSLNNMINLNDQVKNTQISKPLDISDKQKWKIANKLVELFGGTVTQGN